MNNAGTVLLTIADMSVIETEIEVDETDIPFVQVGQPAKIEIDAFPDKNFPGQGDRSRQQPDHRDRPPPRAAPRTSRSSSRSTVTVPDVRPGLHLHGDDHDGDAPEGARACRFRR